MNITLLNQLASGYGLIYRGGFHATDGEQLPAQDDGSESKTLLLFGQAGDSIWPVFRQSNEIQDGQAHPLDRWSERVGSLFAKRINGKVLLPFGPPPFHPFLQWAQRVEPVQSSKLGLLIHPRYGLWHAYRFAIATKTPIDSLSTTPATPSACVSCQMQPCLTACPVNAFDGNSYDVKTCYRYLAENPDSSCHKEGCQARNACPEGESHHYHLDQKKFHMVQFIRTLDMRYKTENDS